MARLPSSRVNLASIATRLGVSVSTVSRALRGQGGIHPETVVRIVGMAHEMGYAVRTDGAGVVRPGGHAGGPAELRHVLVLSQTISPLVDQRFMAGMSGAAVTANVAILSHMVVREQCESVLDTRSAPASIRAGLVKGIVLLHRWPEPVVKELARQFPCVSVVHDYPGTSIDLIGIDDRGGISELVAHLVAGGYRRIGFFGLCPEVSWSSARYGAYVEAIARAGLKFEPMDCVPIDLVAALSAEEFEASAWAAWVRRQMKAGVDAWVCASSMTGRVLCRYLLQQGVKIPREAGLVSYHGGSYAQAEDLPLITTTDIADEELGAAAIRRLVNRFDHPSESRRSILVPASVAPGATTRAVSVVTERRRPGGGR